jgi:hypothetical protein
MDVPPMTPAVLLSPLLAHDPSPAPLSPQVIGVVREKIMFKARPRALISKPK